MIDDIISSLKSKVSPEMLEKLGVKDDEQEGAINEIVESVKYRVSKEAGRGNIDKMASLFSENENSTEDNAMASKMEGDLIWGFMNKLGFSKEKASGLASSVLPNLLKSITGGLSKNGKNDSGGILDMFGGEGILDKIKGSLGGLFGK